MKHKKLYILNLLLKRTSSSSIKSFLVLRKNFIHELIRINFISYDLILTVLKLGANTNEVDIDGNTPLHTIVNCRERRRLPILLRITEAILAAGYILS